MTLVNAFEDEILKLIFQAVAIADYAENDSSSPATVLWVSLHTADPGETGTQTTNEANYTGYGRVSVARTSGGWAVSNPTASNVAAITFGQCTAGSSTVTHVGIGRDQTTAGKLLMSGALSASLAVTAGITPSFAGGALTITLD